MKKPVVSDRNESSINAVLALDAVRLYHVKSSLLIFAKQENIASTGNWPSPSITPIYLPLHASNPLRMSHPIAPCFGSASTRTRSNRAASRWHISGDLPLEAGQKFATRNSYHSKRNKDIIL